MWVSRYGGRAKRDDEVTVRAASCLCRGYSDTWVLGYWALGGGHHSFEQMRLRTHCPSPSSQYTQYVEKLARWLAGWCRCQHVDLSGVLLTKAPLLHCSIAPLLFTHAPRFLPIPKYHGWWAGGQNRECHVIFRASSVFLIVWECSVQSPISSSKVLIPPTLPPPF